MSSRALSLIQQLKTSCLSRGISITKDASDSLTEGGNVPLSIHEYATTGGVTLELDGAVFVNAPFDEWFCDSPESTLDIDKLTGEYFVTFRGESFSARILSLPGYLGKKDAHGYLIQDAAMSHADRVRISPITGCSFACKFCDSPISRNYSKRPLDQLLFAFSEAKQDKALPIKHAIISGGTPRPSDYSYYDEVCEMIIRNADIAVDVMMWPRPDNIIDRLADWGVYGYALNIEVFDEEIARQLIPQKRRLGISVYAEGIERALQRTGGNGRVRSLIIVGLEPPEKTLQGVEFLARLGCDPTLSPFRPGRGTILEHVRPPSPELLERVYLESSEIVERYGVKLGPRCIPCQHNTLTFPDDSGKYFFS
jgi:pyruvate-formate lyase-activating enzyme